MYSSPSGAMMSSSDTSCGAGGRRNGRVLIDLREDIYLMGVRGVEPVELGPGYERGILGSFSVLGEQVGGPVVNDEGFGVEVPLRGGKGLLVRVRDGEVFDGRVRRS